LPTLADVADGVTQFGAEAWVITDPIPDGVRLCRDLLQLLGLA
jgi:hypothetical protein